MPEKSIVEIIFSCVCRDTIFVMEPTVHALIVPATNRIMQTPATTVPAGKRVAGSAARSVAAINAGGLVL
jgi:hypothetical protein